MSESLSTVMHVPTPIGGDAPDSCWLDVAKFPQFQYSMRQVERAGKALKRDITWSEDRREEILQIFRIANNFLDSHAYPMAKIRRETIGRIRHLKLQGITPARLKRMPSVRRKLTKLGLGLNQLQDLGGCRAIVPSIADARRLIVGVCDRTKHVVAREDAYIEKPKPDGYRCHHIVLKFVGEREEETFNQRRIELQIRTRLQHSWATAVESVGLFRREDMKGGQGDLRWLRLFRLMSEEFAVAENCPLSLPDLPERERREEIKELDKELKAAQTLETLRDAFHYTESYVLDPDSFVGGFYLIVYNYNTNQVDVEPYSGPIEGLEELHNVEETDLKQPTPGSNAVLVQIDDLNALKQSYPNYFGDVSLFLGRGGPGIRDSLAAWLRWILGSITPPVSPVACR